MLGKRNKILAQKAEERAKAVVEKTVEAPPAQLADSIAEPAEEFKTPVKKRRKKKAPKKDQ